MGLVLRDVLQYVVQPTLQYLAPEIPNSRGAERLLLGTALHESRMQWLDQTTPGPGPAYGLWQMEAPTHDDLWTRFLEYRPALAHKLRTLRAPWATSVDQLRWNLPYACGMARVLYFRSPDRMPDVDDVDAMAAWAKRTFNTIKGKATVDDYRRALVMCGDLFA